MSAIPNQINPSLDALPVRSLPAASTEPIKPSEAAPAPSRTYHFEGPGQKLSVEQLARYNKILGPAKKIVLTPKLAGDKAAFPKIEFTPGQLLPFLMRHLSGKIRGPAYVTGGAASNILTGIEYADVDLSCYMHTEKDMKLPLALIQKFIAWKLGKIPGAKGNEEMPPENLHEQYLTPEDISHINYYYLKKKVKVFGKFSVVDLGKLEFKCILIGNNPRSHISTSDGFHIPIPLGYPKGQPDRATSSEPNFVDALDALKSRRMIVSAPGEVPLKRLVHKMTQGFEIDSETEVVNASLASLVKEYDHTDEKKMTDFKTAIVKHYDNHYDPDNVKGRMLDFLNFCTLIVQVENKDARNAYLKSLIEVWKAMKYPLLNPFISFAEKDLKNVNDLLAFMRGIFLLEWTNQNPSITAYAFDFASQGRASSARLHFSLKHDHGTQYLAIPGHPGRIAEEFLASWRNLAKRHADLAETAFTELAQGLGLSSILLTPSHRPVVVKTLLDRYGQAAISTVMDVNYKSAISPAPFCKAIEREVIAMEADGCDVIAPEYVFKKTMQYRLEFFRASMLKCGRTNVLKAVDSILPCLKSPQGKPSGNYLASIGDAFSIQDLYFLTDQERSSLASFLIKQWLAGLSSEQPEEILALFKIARTLKNWPGKTTDLDKQLTEFLQTLALMLQPASESLCKSEKTEHALDCLSAALTFGVIQPKEAQLLCIKLASQADANGLGIQLRLAASVASQVFNTFRSEDAELFLKIAKSILTLSSTKFEKDKAREDYTKLGLNLLKELAKKSNETTKIRRYLWNAMADILALENTPAVIRKRFLIFCDVFGELPDHKASHKKLINLAETVVKDYLQSLKDFILIVSEIDSSIAISIVLLKPKFTSEMPGKDRQKLLWDLFNQLINSKESSDIESAYEIWEAGVKGEESPLPLNVAVASLTLATTLLKRLPNSSDDKVENVFNAILPALKDLKYRLSPPLSDAAQQLQKELLTLIKLLVKSGKPASLQMMNDIFDAVGDSCLLSSGNKLAVYRDIIASMDLPDWAVMQCYLDLSFASTDKTDNALALETIRSVMERCLKTPQDHAYRLMWECIAFLSKKNIWSDAFDKLLTSFSKAASSEVALKTGYRQSAESYLPRCINDLLSQISSENREALLKMTLPLGSANLYQELWKAFQSHRIPKPETLRYCTLFLEFSAKSHAEQWLPVLKTSILQPKLLADNSFSVEERGTAYHQVFTYLSQIFYATTEKRVQNEYLQLIETLWGQVPTLLSDASQVATRQMIKNIVLEVYINAATADSLIASCRIIASGVKPEGVYLHYLVQIMVQFEALPPAKITRELILELGQQLSRAPKFIEIEECGRLSETLENLLPILWNSIRDLSAKDNSIYTDIIFEALLQLKKSNETQFMQSLMRRNLIKLYKNPKSPKAFIKFCELMTIIGTAEDFLEIQRDVLNVFARLQEQYAAEAEKHVSKLIDYNDGRPQPMSSFTERFAAVKEMQSKKNPIYSNIIGVITFGVPIDLRTSPLTPQERVGVICELFNILEASANALWDPKQKTLRDWPYEIPLKTCLTPIEWEQYSKRIRESVLTPFAQSVTTLASNPAKLNEKCSSVTFLLPLFKDHDPGLGRKVISNLFAVAALPAAPYCDSLMKLRQQATFYPQDADAATPQVRALSSQPKDVHLDVLPFQDRCNILSAMLHVSPDSPGPINVLTPWLKMCKSVSTSSEQELTQFIDATLSIFTFILAKRYWNCKADPFKEAMETIFRKLMSLEISNKEDKARFKRHLVRFFTQVYQLGIICDVVHHTAGVDLALIRTKKELFVKDPDGSRTKAKDKIGIKKMFSAIPWNTQEDFIFEEMWRFNCACVYDQHPMLAGVHEVPELLQDMIKEDKMHPISAYMRGFTAVEIMKEVLQKVVIPGNTDSNIVPYTHIAAYKQQDFQDLSALLL